jgi:pimeloyl-ACP methyl ester carboxylesterase
MTTTNDKKNIQDKPANRRRSCLGFLGRGAIGVVIFLVIVLVAGLIYQATASASDLKKYPPPGELYDVGDYRLHLYCTGDASPANATGEGSPTVILEAGSGFPALTWYLVQKEVRGFSRVCSYDRPGYGWSDSASGPLSPAQVATDLHKLLETAGVPGPYILVGHSAGGYYIRAYVNQYPSEVVGMVLVDAAYEQQDRLYPPEFIKLMNNSAAMLPLCQIMAPFGGMRIMKILNALLPANLLPEDVEGAFLSTIHRTSYCKSMANETEAVASFRSHPDLPNSLGDLPLIVLSAGISADEEYAQMGGARSGISREVYAKVYEANQEMQKELASLSTHGQQVLATESGHLIHYTQPDLVIDAIHTIFEQVRGK